MTSGNLIPLDMLWDRYRRYIDDRSKKSATAQIVQRLHDGESLTREDAAALGKSGALLSITIREMRKLGYKFKLTRVKGNLRQYTVVRIPTVKPTKPQYRPKKTAIVTARTVKEAGALSRWNPEADYIRPDEMTLESKVPIMRHPQVGDMLAVRSVMLCEDNRVLIGLRDHDNIYQCEITGWMAR